MALANFTDLKAAVAAWLDRDDLTSVIPDFITLCEDDLNKKLRVKGMEVRATSTVSTEYVELPDGFLEMKNFQINTSPKQVLRFVTPEYIDTFWAGSTTGKPLIYTMIAGQIQLAPAPDGSYTAEMTYYKKLDIATDATNWVLTNSPSVYLYGSLLAAEPYLRNDQRIQTVRELYERAMSALTMADSREQHSGGSLAIRADISPV